MIKGLCVQRGAKKKAMLLSRCGGGWRMSEFDHVLERFRSLMDLTDFQRKYEIKKDRWVKYPKAEYIIDLVGTMLYGPLNVQAECLLIHGEPGMGKTSIIDKIQERFGRGSGANAIAAIVKLKDEKTFKEFKHSIYKALTGDMDIGGRVFSEEAILRVVRALNIRVLGIDELHHVEGFKGGDDILSLQYLKSLSGAPFHLCLLGAGTTKVNNAIGVDRQLSRRFHRIELQTWKKGAELEDFLFTFQSTLPLRLPSNLTGDIEMDYILKESKGELGEMINLIKHSAIWSIIDGVEKITIDMLQKGKFKPVIK